MSVILVSSNYFPAEKRRLYQGKALEYAEVSMCQAIAEAGGLPVMALRAGRKDEELAEWAKRSMALADGLVLTGGEDVEPKRYGEEPRIKGWKGHDYRDAMELALYDAALEQKKPVLGICRGAQVIAVAEGGSLWQDLDELRSKEQETHSHRNQELYDKLEHPIVIEAEFLKTIFGDEAHIVNSVHHQAMRRVPESLKVVARAKDGVPECYVHQNKWVMAVQWHPEWIDRPSAKRLMAFFLEAAKEKRDMGPW